MFSILKNVIYVVVKKLSIIFQRGSQNNTWDTAGMDLDQGKFFLIDQ
jgi:hypothetical protein